MKVVVDSLVMVELRVETRGKGSAGDKAVQESLRTWWVPQPGLCR